MTQMLLLVDQRQPESKTHAACVVKRFWQLPGKKKRSREVWRTFLLNKRFLGKKCNFNLKADSMGLRYNPKLSICKLKIVHHWDGSTKSMLERRWFFVDRRIQILAQPGGRPIYELQSIHSAKKRKPDSKQVSFNKDWRFFKNCRRVWRRESLGVLQRIIFDHTEWIKSF